jgi:H+/Cl- antiporter ClcA
MARRQLRRARRNLFSPKAWKTRVVFWSGAVMVGVAAVVLALDSEHANGQFQRLTEISPYLPLLTCPLGFGLIAWLTVRYFPGAQGSGIPQAMAALEMNEHSLRWGTFATPCLG